MSTKSLSNALELICGFIWPPVPLRKVQLTETDEQLDARYDALVKLWTQRAKQATDIEFFVEEANRLYDLEFDRKNIVETKGSSLIGVTGLALTLTTIGLTLVAREFAAGGWPLRVVMAAICAAIVYFIGSGYYAVRATQILPFWTATTYGFAHTMGQNMKIEWVAQKLAQTEMNYDVTRLRTNYLSVSQSMLLRGLLVLTVVALLLFSVLPKTTVPPSNSTAVSR